MTFTEPRASLLECNINRPSAVTGNVRWTIRRMIRFAILAVFTTSFSPLIAQDDPGGTPPASLEALASTIGDSLQEITNEKTSLVPDRMVGKRRVSRKWILDRRFIEESAVTEFAGFKGESRSIFTFDKHKSVFRWWTFDTYGIASEFVGTWIPGQRMIKWTMAQPRNDGYTHTVVERVHKNGSVEWKAEGRQRDGTLAVHQTGKSIPSE